MMKKYSKYFILYLVVFVSVLLNAQQHKIDSLEKLLLATKEDTSRFNLLNILSFKLLSGNSQKAMNYANEMLTIVDKLETKQNNEASRKRLKKRRAEAFNSIGNAYDEVGDVVKAKEIFNKALKINEEIGDKLAIAGCYHNIGIIYQTEGNLSLALEYFFKALKINEEQGSKKNMASNFNNIGNIYLQMKNLENALTYYNKAIVIKIETGDKKGECSGYLNIGNIYNRQKKFDKAISYYRQSAKISREIKNEKGLANTYNNIANIFVTTNKDSAFLYYKNALVISEKIAYKAIICAANLNLADIYLSRKKNKEAIECLNIGVKTAIEMNSVEYIKEAYWIMSEDYAKMNDFKMAYMYHLNFTKFKDSLLDKESTKQIAEMGAKYETEKKDKEIILLNKDNALHQKEIEKQSAQRNAFIVGFILVFLLTLFIFRGYKQKQKANDIIQMQKKLVEEKNKDITDSINYAKRIQEALLPQKELKYKLFPDAFVLFQPRDIVSGDFYWFAERNGKKIIAAVDCTGHGVPGAFMSMIGNAFLNEIVNEKGITEPGIILSELRHLVINALKQSGAEGEQRDGMDISILSFSESNEVQWAGANNRLLLIRNGECKEYTPDKRPIGFFRGKGLPFKNHKIEIQKNDSLYIFTDGYADQFGGPNGKKLKYKYFLETILTIQNRSMANQEEILLKKINDWKGDLEQVDDILVIGIRV